MKKRILLGIVLTLLLFGIVMSAFSIQPVEASTVDIIHPQPGQFANYYQEGDYGYGWWNTSYNEYVQPHVINTTHASWHSAIGYDTYWCTVDKRNRLVTDGNYTYWNQTWYFLWIETNVSIGSTIKWSDTNATIVGSEVVYAAGGYVDCWIAYAYGYDSYILSYYDKVSGVMVDYRYFYYGSLTGEVILEETNIPIGWLSLATKVYFNLNPNPVGVGDTVTLKGVLLDEYSQPVSNETVKLYARPLAGSWSYIASLTIDGYGIFSWQATIPSVTGTFIFAVYYPGSEMYESCYNFAILIIQ